MFSWLRPASPSKKLFHAPQKFEYDLHLLLRLAASFANTSYITLSVTAYRKDKNGRRAGDIEVTLSGIADRASSMMAYSPSAYAYFYGAPNYRGDGVIRILYHEPDCYFWGCPREPFLNEVREHAPNAYLDDYFEYPSSSEYAKSAVIKFEGISYDEETQNWFAFEKYCDIWHP